jgi:hypothetical protein
MVHSEHMETFVCDHISPTARAFSFEKVVAEIDAAIHTPIRRCDEGGARYSGQWGVQSGRSFHATRLEHQATSRGDSGDPGNRIFRIYLQPVDDRIEYRFVFAV